MSKPTKDSVEYLLTWLENQAKPLIKKYAEHAEYKINSIELDEKKLRYLNAHKDREISVCFLGSSAVGKSTLLNALVADTEQVVPSGGIGPLTAQAIEVCYSGKPFFEVEYHGPVALNRVVFAIASKAQAELRFIEETEESNNNGDSLEQKAPLSEKCANNSNSQLANDWTDAAFDKATLVNQANLLIRGNQFANLPLEYLEISLGALLGALGKEQPVEIIIERLTQVSKSKVSAECIEQNFSSDQIKEDANRIHALRKILTPSSANKKHRQDLEDGARNFFRDELKNHTAGFLSPLIKNIKVGWPSEFLKKRIKLVDLPGIGVGSDSYRKITENYVSAQARAVVMVVDKAGPTESSIELLRTSGYWNRLIASAYDPTIDPATMLLAVTKVDDLASEEYARTIDDNAEASRENLFLQVCDDLRSRMRQQVENQLTIGMQPKGDQEFPLDNSILDSREKARKNVLDSLQIHPVSAHQMRELIRRENGQDAFSFLRTREQTGIPGLRASLVELAENEQNQRERNIRELSQRIISAAVNEIEIIQQSFLNNQKTDEETEKIRVFLEQKLQPIQIHYIATRNQFKTYLIETIPSKIEGIVKEAQLHTLKETSAYLGLLRRKNIRWQTLNAVIRHGGSFKGAVARRVDLPGKIAEGMEESILANWGEKIVIDIRDRTNSLVNYIKNRVDELCSGLEPLGVSPVLLATQKNRLDSLKVQMESFATDAVRDMHDIVKITLKNNLHEQIELACKSFQDTGEGQGEGAKERILKFFENMTRESIEDIEVPVSIILKNSARKVTDKIEENFSLLGNLFQQTVDLILQKRQDMNEENRRHLRDEVGYIIRSARNVSDTLGV